MASSSQNVELEAAKFLHKLIQDSKDEPAKLATKLYVILQHMKSSGKEHSMPFQVISRAMETVINQHGLDLEALKSSRLPPTVGSQTLDSTSGQYAGSSHVAAVPKDSKAGLAQIEMPKFDPFSSSRQPVGPSIAGHEYYQGTGTHKSSQSFDHESPSSLDTRSANSQSQDKQMSQNDSKKAITKRKRGDSLEPKFDTSQQLDSRNAVMDPRKGKVDKAEQSVPTNYNMVQSSVQMEHFPSLPGNMRSALRGRQDGQNIAENLVDSTSNLISRAPGSKYPEEVEDSSTQNVPGQQQGGLLVAHENFPSRGGVWNQNKAGLTFDRSQLHRFSPNVVSGSMTAEIAPHQSMHASLVPGAFGKFQGLPPATSNSYPAGDLSSSGPGQFGGFDYQRHGLSKGSVVSPDGLSTTLSAGNVLEHDGGSSTMLADANKTVQAGRQNIASEMTMVRGMTPRDMGKSPVSQSAMFSGMPFKEQQLKQLRAQCLVFLAFRNGLMPKKQHLEIALGNIFPKEVGNTDGPHKELNDNRGKSQTSSEPGIISEVAMPFERMDNVPPGSTYTGRFSESDSLSKEAEALKVEESNGQTFDVSAIVEEKKRILARRNTEAEIQSHETVERQAYLPRQPESTTKQVNPEMMGWSGIGSHNEVSRASLPAAAIQHDLVLHRKDIDSQFQSPEQDEEDNSVPTDPLPSPKHTMSEIWIMDQRKRKVLAEQKWVLKQQKTRQRVFSCFTKLKETVSSSKDISAKTKSVIELKKLQLLELQLRLRRDFLNDYFKPITNDMERLKSYKKYKHGRRIKQLEKYEFKMKEERQKRIRERQKEFFSEIEVHKERLDDVFKIRRERWKGFNKYVKEFHKRKERIHREKIDRIQREKINLLKINDVEGYLRMVQDAKSDRVKQLLKATEKYLQKLGSKLRDAKAMGSRFGNDIDEMRSASVFENDTTVENEDEAKHYVESNEKYYLMAHSIKENINEQPTFLKGGKLREYQMNGLRWLVSLYNNHLNGILADEMGLGKTVQVISLICYLMETKNDRGPFLVVVPSSVLPGWESEINFWAPDIHKIVYSGPPEERRRLFKERIVHQKFNVLLTTYEYLMNKHDRPKLSKIHWHYVIIDEGHRIKNASCKLNADLKHYQSSHRLLLTGTPLQNNLEELWALLNFLLPNIFNSSEDFSQWFNKPFEGNGDNSADEALLSEEENLLIINRLHQVLRPFVLRRLKHKVENQLPEKIERLVRCEPSAYQKLLMKRIEENLGAIGNAKARSVHNSVMELRNICNHPYLSHLHVEEVDSLIPKHYLPPIIRLCGKLEMLDRLLPKLMATDHRILFFSTMTRLLDVMEDYLTFKQYRYLRLDGHTSGGDRGALIEKFNQQGSPFFIFLLSIRAGGVGVNLQAADTVIIFDTDWNPQVDLQAQARAHRIGQKKDVLVLRFETVQTVEEQVRAAAEHKLGVANQSITAGFFDNNTSAEDRREYLESLLRESKKEEAAPVLDDDALNDMLARSESEIDVFESVDKKRREEEMAKWKNLVYGSGIDSSKPLPPLPPRLVTDNDLKEFYEAMKLYEVPKTEVLPNIGSKRKGESLGGLDTHQYGRGKRAREVRSYEEQLTEEQFEKLCQLDLPESPELKEEAVERNMPEDASRETVSSTEAPAPAPLPPLPQPRSLVVEPAHQPLQQSKDATPPPKRGRGRPRRATVEKSPTTPVFSAPSESSKVDVGLLKTGGSSSSASLDPNPHITAGVSPIPSVSNIPVESNPPPGFSPPVQSKGLGQKAQTGGQAPRRRAKKQEPASIPVVDGLAGSGPEPNEQSQIKLVNPPDNQAVHISGIIPGVSGVPMANNTNPLLVSAGMDCTSVINHPSDKGVGFNSQSVSTSGALIAQPAPCPTVSVQVKGQGRKAPSGVGTPRRTGKKRAQVSVARQDVLVGQDSKLNTQAHDQSADASPNKNISMRGNEESDASAPTKVIQEQAQGANAPAVVTDRDKLSTGHDNLSQRKRPESSQEVHNATAITRGHAVGQIQNTDAYEKVSVITEVSPECSSEKAKSGEVSGNQVSALPVIPVSSQTSVESVKSQISEGKVYAIISTVKTSSSVASAMTDYLPTPNPLEEANKTVLGSGAMTASISQPFPTNASVSSAAQSAPSCLAESVQSRRPGRKTTNRAEAPRRRGRKPVVPDASSGQDFKVNSLPSNKSKELLANKATVGKSDQDSASHELAIHGSEIHSPGASIGNDSKRKVTSAIPVYSRPQTADVSDVARVMKEIFSETSSKTKAGETAGSEGRNTTAPLLNKTLAKLDEKSLDGKSAVSTQAREKATACVPEEESKTLSVTEADAKELENNASLVVKASAQRADSVKPSCKTHTGSDNAASSGQVRDGNLMTRTNMDQALVDSCNLESGGSEAKGDSIAEPVLAVATACDVIELVPQDGGALQQPLVVKDGENNGVELHNMEVDTSRAVVPSLKDSTADSASGSPAPEVNAGKQAAGVESTNTGHVEGCHKEVKAAETPSSETSMQPLEIALPVSGILQDKSIEQSRTEVDANKSEEKSPVIVLTTSVENNSEFEPEHSLKSSPKASSLDVENFGGAAMSTKPNADDVLPVTSNISPGHDPSAMELPSIAQNELGKVLNPTGLSSSNDICDASSLQSGNSDDKELVLRSEVNLVEACRVESNPMEGPSMSQAISDNFDDIQRSEVEVALVEACRVESDPTEEGPSLSQVIPDESANPEVTHDNNVRTELQSKGHAEAFQQPKPGSADISNVEIDSTEAKVTSPQQEHPNIGSADLSNMKIDPTETKVYSPQPEDAAEASQQPKVGSSDVSPMEVESEDHAEVSQLPKAVSADVSNTEMDSTVTKITSSELENPKIESADLSNMKTDPTETEVHSHQPEDVAEASQQLKVGSFNVSTMEIESEDRAEASQQPKAERAGVSNMEIDSTETKDTSLQPEHPKIESADLSNLERGPTETEVLSRQLEDTAEASKQLKVGSSDVSSIEVESEDCAEASQQPKAESAGVSNMEIDSTETEVTSLQPEHPKIESADLSNLKTGPTETEVLSRQLEDTAEASQQLKVVSSDVSTMEVESEDRAEASPQPMAESGDVSHTEIDFTETEVTSLQPEHPKVESADLSNMKTDPTETEVHSRQPEDIAEASQQPKVGSSNVSTIEVESEDRAEASQQPKAESAGVSNKEIDSTETEVTSLQPEHPKIESADLSNMKTDPTETEVHSRQPEDVAEASQQLKVVSFNGSTARVESEDRAEASQQPKAESADVSNTEIDITETKVTSVQPEHPKVESVDLSNLKTDPTETEVLTRQLEDTIEASQEPKVGSSDVSPVELESKDHGETSLQPKVESADVSNTEIDSTDTNVTLQLEHPKIESDDPSNLKTDPTGIEVHSPRPKHVAEASPQPKVESTDVSPTELESKDHAEASQLPKAESADVSNTEIDSTDTRVTLPQPEHPKIGSADLSNLKINPTETEVHSPQPKYVAEASQQPEVGSSDVSTMEVESTEPKLFSPGGTDETNA